MTVSATLPGAALLLGRIPFALVVGYLALGNLLALDSSIGYATHKGVPLASVSVPVGSLGLIAGSLAVLTGLYPGLGASAVIAFLVPITVVMHDFWTMDGQERENERVHFLKSVGLIGFALVFLALTTATWPVSIGVGL